jgi:hypothetical protein
MTERDNAGAAGAARAYAECDHIAEDCVCASGSGAYADGYRAAGETMRHEIARLQAGRPRTPLERDLRDAEVEGQTLARVLRVAERFVEQLPEGDPAEQAVRAFCAEFFDGIELSSLRTRADPGSAVRLTSAPQSNGDVLAAAGADLKRSRSSVG